MNIVKLTTENVKRLSAVTITPTGNMVVIGGRNGQGKSSVLDSIEFALGGDPSAKMPVRRGEEKARVVVDLGEIVVKRTFTAAGGTALVVTNADGQKQASPQAILDKLTGKLTFDPLAFSRQTPKQQAETLMALVGLDFAQHEARRQAVFDERTAVNREAKALENRMAAMPKHDGAPEKETSTADILAEQQEAARKNAGNAEQRRIATELESAAKRFGENVEAAEESILEAKQEILNLQAKLSALESACKDSNAKLSAATEKANAARERAEKLTDADLSPFQKKAAECEANNRKVRENRQRAEVVAQFKAKSDKAEELTGKLAHFDAEKRAKITAAKYPIEGMSFDTAGGVVLNGIPFEQCSSAEQLRVSVAIGLALNPTLRVLLIRDGSLLDDDSLAMLAKMAADTQAQVWVERVGTDAATSVVIEDGHVAGQEPKELL